MSSNKVTAKAMDVVTESSGNRVVPMAPNVCVTPAAPSPLPMPYPVIGQAHGNAAEAEKVKMRNQELMTKQASVKGSKGNDGGVLKDVSTNFSSGASWALPVPAVTTHFEGAPVNITENPGFSNANK